MIDKPHELPSSTTPDMSQGLDWSFEGGDKDTSLARLLELYSQGDAEAFNAELDDIVYASLEDNRAFMNNIQRIHAKTTSREEQENIRDAQRRIFNERKQAILREMGINSRDEQAQFDEKRDLIQAKLANAEVKGTESEGEILKILGIIDVNENGEDQFTYPADLFPGVTNEKWEAYLGSVKNHIQKSRDFGSGMIGKEDVELADRARRVAHNSVSRDIDGLLGLNLLPEATWDFEKTRRLVVKMREKRFPNIETAEKLVTTGAIARGLAAAAALAAKHETI